MSVNDQIGKRMKMFYEEIPKSKLMRRCPVAIRIDGRAFHTFTNGFQKPFDEVLINSMQETMKYLCENIQGCVFGYTQSDEITLILIDYKKINSSVWFDYEVQKMCSIAASMATMAFNKYFFENVCNYENEFCHLLNSEYYQRYYNIYLKRLDKAMFDARCFNVPKEEVTNLIFWRQLDAMRNSIQMVGQANFSHKELQNKSCTDIQNMLLTQKGIDWNSLPPYKKRGTCAIKHTYRFSKYTEQEAQSEITNHDSKSIIERSEWIIDKEIPIFKYEGRKYIDDLIFVGE